MQYMPTDQILITGLEIQAIIGVYPWERKLKQVLLLDLTLPTDTSQAAHEDELVDALDYAALCQAVTHWAGGTQFQLIESFAEHLAKFLNTTFDLPWVKITLKKPKAVSNAAGVAVQIERQFR